MAKFQINLTDEEISQISYKDFKDILKNKVWTELFKDLTEIKLSHSKVRNICHDNIDTPQDYLFSSSFSKKRATSYSILDANL